MFFKEVCLSLTMKKMLLGCLTLKRLGHFFHHRMETFSVLLGFVQGIHWSPVNSPHKGQWCWTLKFSFICTWTNSWINNRQAGDLRCHKDNAHSDVIIMKAVSFVERVKTMSMETESTWVPGKNKTTVWDMKIRQIKNKLLSYYRILRHDESVNCFKL